MTQVGQPLCRGQPGSQSRTMVYRTSLAPQAVHFRLCKANSTRWRSPHFRISASTGKAPWWPHAWQRASLTQPGAVCRRLRKRGCRFGSFPPIV